MTKKVLRIISRLNIGGPAIHVTNLNYYLDKDFKYNSTLVYGSLAAGEGSMEYLATEKNLKTIIVPELGREISLVKDFVTLYKLYKLIKQEKPDIVHTHTAKAGLARLAAKFAGVKQIYHTFHGHVFHSYFSWFKTQIFINIERFLALLSNKIIAISPKQKQELLDFKICSAKKIEVIPLGFDLKKFSVPATGCIKNKYNLNRFRLIGIIGRLVPIKNHAYFIDLAKKISEKKPDVRFVIIGDGEIKTQLIDQVNQLGLTDKVIFTGFLSDLPGVYADLDLVLLTSFNEGTPVAVIEALACGKPVASTNVGGVSDILIPGKTGWLLNNKITEDTQTILNILDDPEAVWIAARGREMVQQNYNISRLVTDIEKLYREN